METETDRHARVVALVPHDLVRKATDAAGPGLSRADVVRLGLATLAGVDVEPYTPAKGWPKGRPRKAS